MFPYAAILTRSFFYTISRDYVWELYTIVYAQPNFKKHSTCIQRKKEIEVCNKG